MSRSSWSGSSPIGGSNRGSEFDGSTLEYMIITRGTATLVTGGTLIAPTIDSDPYPNANPNATIRSEAGVSGGVARKIGPGDVLVNLPGTPHWFTEIADTIEYVEIQ